MPAGSPRMYYSAYDSAVLGALKLRLGAAARSGANTWCICDNTAEGAAVADALYTLEGLAAG